MDKRLLIIYDGRNYIRTTDISMELIDELLDKGYIYVEYNNNKELEQGYNNHLTLEKYDI